jgi:hypothetical protein
MPTLPVQQNAAVVGVVCSRWQAAMLLSTAHPRPILVKLLQINGIKVYYFQSIACIPISRHTESGICNELSVLFSMRYLQSDPPHLGKTQLRDASNGQIPA